MLRRAFLACLLALAAALPAWATVVVPLTLDDLSRVSTVIFEGTCVDNRVERDASTNRIVTYTTFTVADVIKGDVGSTYTIKQIGGELPDEAVVRHIHGIPKFQVGEEYVVFMAGVSSAGFSSPIGLSQGRFKVKRENGRRQVTNGRDFRELTADIPEADLPPGFAQRVVHAPQSIHELDIDEFKQIARSRARSGR